MDVRSGENSDSLWNCSENCLDSTITPLDLFNASDATNTTEWERWSSIMVMAATSTILGLMILATIIGNVFVIAAVFFEKNLQNVANYLIVSLAVADLMVACLVMPLGAVYEISGNWILGQLLCDMWTSSDVLCCTASILHLVAIAVDRYWAVTDIEYIRSRNRGRINTMIFLVWLVAAIVSLAPFMGWKDPNDVTRAEVSSQCIVSQDMGYQIFATCATFYVPLCIILLLYWKIWKTARRRIRHRPGRIQEPNHKKNNKSSSSNCISAGNNKMVKTLSDLPQCSRETTEFSINPSPTNLTPTTPTLVQETVEINTISGLVESVSSPSIEVTIDPAEESKTSNGFEEQPLTTLSPGCCGNNSQQMSPSSAKTVSSSPKSQQNNQKTKKKESIEAKRERKAAKTLAIITGAFVFCWLPFFIMVLTLALCSSCLLPQYVFSALQWLGYFNSTLNPIIYTLFSPEFRMAFKRILCGNRARGRK